MSRTNTPKRKMSRPLVGGLAALTGVGLMSTSLLAQVQPVLVIEKSDMSSWAPSEKDAALARALEMLPARLNELPGEIPDFPAEARPVIDLILTLITREGRMSITYNPDDNSQLMGYGVTFRVATKDADDARAMHQSLLGFLSDSPAPIEASQRFEGMSQIATPAGQVHFGPSNAGGDWGYVLQFGAVDDPSDGFDALPESPEGMTSIVRAHMDFAALDPMVQFGLQMAGGVMGDSAMLDESVAMLEESGLIGERTIKIDYNAGYTDEYSVERFSIIDARWAAEPLGLPTEPLTREELRAIPGDAVMASMARFDFGQFNEILDMMSEFGLPVEDGLAQFREQTGIDVRTDVFGAMGNTVAAYTSDSTGGGSLLSGVVLLGVGDHDRLADTLAKLAGLANQAMQMEMDENAARYVSVASWNHGGHDLISLRFNGIPIPLELSLALTDDWLILGATPQAVIAAADQASGDGDGGLGNNPAFVGQLDSGRQYVSVNFLDAQRLAKGGYPFACMLGSAVANGVRSPGLRDPGLVVPTFHELMDGARASVGGSYWDGEDYVTEWRGDRSVLVQVSVMGGAIGQFAPIIGAIAVPAIAGSRQFSIEDLDPAVLARMLRAGVWVDPVDRALLAMLATQVQPKALRHLKGGLE